MGVKGKLVSQISIKYPKGDAFQLFKFINNFSQMSPQRIQSVDLLAGQWGAVGSVLRWDYTIDGEKKVAKDVIEAVDEKKKSITYKVMEGDLMEHYNSFKMNFTVDDTKGEDNLVTVTLDYEKKSEAVPDPHKIMDHAIATTRDMERHHLVVSN